MSWCHNCLTKKGPLYNCSRCHNTSYCSKECQRKDWKSHKIECNNTKVKLKDQRQALSDGVLKLEYVNPRHDRRLEKHGCDTRPVKKMNTNIKKAAKAFNLNPKLAKVLCIYKDYQGPYGLCFQNSIAAKFKSKNSDSSIVWGWTIWVGKYMVEAECHCVLEIDGTLYNTTVSMDNIPYSTLFIPDDTFKEIQPNKIFWI